MVQQDCARAYRANAVLTASPGQLVLMLFDGALRALAVAREACERPAVDPPVNWSAPYVRKAIPADPWGHPYVYVSPGRVNPTGYDLLSYGADGQPGGEGKNPDLTSWK